MSFVDLYSPSGDVVRCVYVDPSESCTSCVNVYGRRGRRIIVACRVGVVENAAVRDAGLTVRVGVMCMCMQVALSVVAVGRRGSRAAIF